MENDTDIVGVGADAFYGGFVSLACEAKHVSNCLESGVPFLVHWPPPFPSELSV